MSTGPAVVIEDRITVPATAFDHAGYRAWVTSADYSERVRTTFVRGEVLVEMIPESLEKHHKVKGAVTAALFDFARANDLGEVYADGTLVTNEEAGVSTEPDLSFVSWATFEAGRVQLRKRTTDETDYIELVGRPDLVVEIVSDSSARKDTELLREAYCRAGVQEYWLIDARRPEIRFEILSNGGEAFVSSGDPAAPQESRVLAGRWRLTRSLNRAGRFSYALDRA